uniref:Uncharacterized protein n=1 Tax=Arundo donax TaxID=35708 RepID=A0A0A9G1X9_ARUDO
MYYLMSCSDWLEKQRMRVFLETEPFSFLVLWKFSFG